MILPQIFIFILFRVGYNCTRSQVFRQKQFIAVSILIKILETCESIIFTNVTLVSRHVWNTLRASHIIALIRALQNSWSTNPEEVNIFLTITLMFVLFSAITQPGKCHVHPRKRRKTSLARSRSFLALFSL